MAPTQQPRIPILYEKENKTNRQREVISRDIPVPPKVIEGMAKDYFELARRNKTPITLEKARKLSIRTILTFKGLWRKHGPRTLEEGKRTSKNLRRRVRSVHA